ncbi:MAG: hypothetical protein ACYDC9_03110 [Dermatophilaceae bacterium]
MAEAQLVESIEFWMRAYPRRWRQARGQELVDVVVDLAGPGARRLDPRAAFDLVRGGWATRWREHPLPHTWLLYRTFDRRIPVAYRSWALDDIDGFWYPIRRFLGGAWLIFLIVLITPLLGGSGEIPVWSLVMVALMVVSSMFITPEGIRSQARLKHVAPRFGEVPVEGALVVSNVPRQRVTARSGLTWAMFLLGTTGAASVVAALLAPKVVLTNFQLNSPDMGPGFGWGSVVAPMGGHRVVAVAILLVALGFGALGAVAVRRRLGRLLGERLDQPYRVVRPVTASGKAGILFSAMAMMGLIWLEVSGQIVFGLSVVPGTVALLLLPGALVALLVTRGADAHDLAGRDVWWIATRGRVPRIDQPARGLRPQPGPVPEGVLVQPPGPTGPPHPATP